MTGGELMAELLVEWNVPYVFGLGGSEEVGFLDALVDRLALQYVHGIHEASVMSMADGYARATGEVPIMNLHSVAGAAYALGPMVNAFKDRIPIVVTVGRQSTEIRGTNAFLESVNLHQLPQEYTQWTWDVMNAETIPETWTSIIPAPSGGAISRPAAAFSVGVCPRRWARISGDRTVNAGRWSVMVASSSGYTDCGPLRVTKCRSESLSGTTASTRRTDVFYTRMAAVQRRPANTSAVISRVRKSITSRLPRATASRASSLKSQAKSVPRSNVASRR